MNPPNIELDEKGIPTLIIKNKNDCVITDESLIRKIKKTEKYKQSVSDLIQKRKNFIDEETDKFLKIFKYTPEIISEERIKSELDALKPEVYIIKNFEENAPEIDLIKIELEIIAKKNINNLFFWKNKKLREYFVTENLNKTFVEKIDEWKSKKENFITNENNIKAEKDKDYFNEYIAIKNELEEILLGKNEYIEVKIESIISEITLPVEFALDYEYNSSILKIDLDLPEIEHMSIEKANILSSGKISIKNKTQKELKEEYSQCVSGIAFFLGGTFFNISPKIENIIISGFTQRLNKLNGKVENQYIYSVNFEREIFSNLNTKNINSLDAFQNFENKLNVTVNFEFKTINPL